MALELAFADGFGRYKLGNTSDSEVLGGLLAYWTSTNGGVITASGREGRPGFIPTANVFQGLAKSLEYLEGWTIIFAFKVGTGLADSPLFAARHNGTNIFEVEVHLDGTITVKTPLGNHVVVTDPIHANKFYHLEVNFDLTTFQAEPEDPVTVGIEPEITLWLNSEPFTNGGMEVINTGLEVAGLLMQTATADNFVIRAGSGNIIFSDFAIFRHTTPDLGATQIGDCKIIGVRPNGDTAVSDFTPSVGTVHYSLINFSPPLGDPSSLFSPTVGDQDIWDWQDIPTFTGTIKGVSISIYARKDDEGSRTFKIVTGATGSEEQSDEFFLNDDYVYHHTEQDVDPATTLPYTVSGFNAKQFGVEVTA